MKINFTKDQYRQLLELLYLGEWVANSAKDEEDRIVEYDELYQHVISFAKEFNCDDIITYDESFDAHIETMEYENAMQKHIAKYDGDVFWTELAERLAKRDVLEKLGDQAPNDEVIDELFAVEEKYLKEFAENGMNHISVKKD
ncbi:hypothetical protein QR721_12240 [Aciduricibacillus chroicocephali]|uniref:Uncharacterized protein n=1 Tax=Aciduricibacillus chroicocephali TaxID=3054939 RepID=A0ABY9KV07_9BACI|nr:hypothetical protein QR721_12240 [Bacillaceae bacterium 44XB]